MRMSNVCLETDWARDSRWLHAMAFMVFVLASTPNLPLLAQGLDNEEAIESIVGSPVDTEEHDVDAREAARVIAAIERNGETASEVRKAFNLNEMKIVFIPEAQQEDSPIAAAIARNEAGIQNLRQAIQGNAMFFHSVDSRSISLDDIVALEFGENATATIYVAGRDPNR